MRILRVVSDIYPFVVGGLPLHAHELSKQQSNLGHDITVYTSNVDNISQEPETNYKLLKFKNTFKLFGNSFSSSLFSELFRTRNDFDIIHAHSHLFFSTNICAFIKKMGSSPLVITNHGLVSQTAPLWINRIYIPTLAKCTFKSADKIICYTEKDKLELEHLNIDSDKIKVIHNGINTDLFVPAAKREKTGQLLWIGRFTPGKGVDYLINAFGILLKINPNLRLLLVGKGPLKEQIYQLINNLHLEKNITIKDFIPNSELPEAYRQSDVFILPSINEGVPRTILEAMSCGIPVVCTKLPQLVDIVNGCGTMVPLRDPQALARAVSNILFDEELSKKLGQNGRKRAVENFCWNDTVAKTIDLYRELLCQRS